MMGGGKKLFWSSGASSPHPRPTLEAFARLEMPVDMIEGDGYPPLTDAIKADILGLNYAAPPRHRHRPHQGRRSPTTASAGSAVAASPSRGRG